LITCTGVDTRLTCAGVEVDGCYVHYAAVVEQHMNLYFGAYFWLRVVLAHLVPSRPTVTFPAAPGSVQRAGRAERGAGADDERRPPTSQPAADAPRRCRVTFLGKLFTPIVPLFTKQ